MSGITIQSADPVPLFTVVISGLFTSGASFSLAHEYSTRNQNDTRVKQEAGQLLLAVAIFLLAFTARCYA